MLMVIDNGYQTCLMAPTEILAEQHYEGIQKFLKRMDVRMALLTGSNKASHKKALLEDLQNGKIDILIGTHALIEDNVVFQSLGLAVIDEQHRFGVGQRVSLRGKGTGADLLSMTATPIPRTLALSLYGDMSCSRIRHRPVAGAGITTKVIAPENADLAYGAIRDAVAAGHQAYVICPLVDERDDGAELDDVPERSQAKAKRLHAATVTVQELGRGPLRGLGLDVLTGKMGSEDKEAAMSRFKEGSVDVLVATTVVEVGVDVPNATVMLVFDAGPRSPARQRLAALEATSDGFELAELDLSLRREGEVLGYRQHGGVMLQVSDLAADRDLVEAAHADARALAAADPDLSAPAHLPLALECGQRFGAYFREVERG